MCGINGIIDFHNKFSSEDRHGIVHNMNERIRYRGPNSEGFLDSEKVTLGMRRLAILDLNGGDQPIYNEDKTIAVILNGEIYNFKMLRRNLEEKKHKFYTGTDTEVIVHLYEEYGCDAFKLLDGMFSAALYDRASGKIFVARDRMGEKPLYYSADSELLLFGSELQSIMGTGLVPKKLNRRALNLYLQLTYIPAPYSIYDDVYKLEPGHFLEINLTGQVKDHRYWELKAAFQAGTKKNSYERAQKLLWEKMENSVKDRMHSDVPLGAFLSGGVDSTAIVGLMSRNSSVPVKTFTIGFKEKEYDERKRARRAAEFYHTDHHEYVMKNDKAMESFRDIISHMGEPFADSSALPTYLVSQIASRHVKVVLTGDAGDELFMGYNKYLMDYYASLYHRLPRWLRRGIIERLVRKIPDKSTVTRKIHKVLDNLEKSPLERRVNLMSLGFKAHERRLLLKSPFMDEAIADFLDKGKKLKSNMERTQYTDLKIVLEGDMLTKVDRMSMLHSIETRTPMLAGDIVEFAVQLPMEYKIKGRKLKRIVKDTFKPMLPPDFTKYPKSGFGIPLDYWFRHELKEELRQLFDRDRIERQGIFEWSYIEAILEEHFSGKKNRKNEIWALYVFEKWYEAEGDIKIETA